MIRFGTKTLLFAFALAAVWCSTFGGYSAGRDVRASVMLILFVAAGYAAVYSRGKSRAFWSGMFVVMLLLGGNFFAGPVNKYVPNFSWRYYQPTPTMTVRYTAPPAAVYTPYTPPSVTPPSVQPPTVTYPQPIPAPVAPQAFVATVAASNDEFEFTQAVNDTIATLWTLILGCIVGLVGIWVHGSRADRQPN